MLWTYMCIITRGICSAASSYIIRLNIPSQMEGVENSLFIQLEILWWGQAGISYTPDGTGVTTTYGTWGNNPTGQGNDLFENLEQNRGAEATRTVHLNDNQERALLKIINDYKKKVKMYGNCLDHVQNLHKMLGIMIQANI